MTGRGVTPVVPAATAAASAPSYSFSGEVMPYSLAAALRTRAAPGPGLWEHWRMRFLLHVIVSALALWVAAWLLPGMDITAADTAGVAANAGAGGAGHTVAIVLGYLFLGLIFGLVNAVVKPIVSFLSLPITCLTLGLFALVINAAMLGLTAWISGYTPVHLTIDSFVTAFIGAIIVAIVSAVTGWALGLRKD